MNFNIKFRAFRIGDEFFINKLREDAERESKVGGMNRKVSIDREAKWVKDIIFGDNQKEFHFYVEVWELFFKTSDYFQIKQYMRM